MRPAICSSSRRLLLAGEVSFRVAMSAQPPRMKTSGRATVSSLKARLNAGPCIFARAGETGIEPASARLFGIGVFFLVNEQGRVDAGTAQVDPPGPVRHRSESGGANLRNCFSSLHHVDYSN